jgi:RimJ/RimL family protein N-acetyltransferase
MDELHTGGGYTTEATKGLVNFGFEVLGLSTIHASLCETNLGGLKVVNASGFKLDSISTHKQACRFDNKLHSTKDFTITADEWKEFKAKHHI